MLSMSWATGIPPESAVRAYDAKVVEFYQEAAVLNFPECHESLQEICQLVTTTIGR